MAAYENPTYPNKAAVHFPGVIYPGKTKIHVLSFWKDLKWQPGTYLFYAQADAGMAIQVNSEATTKLFVPGFTAPGKGFKLQQP